MTRSFAHIHTEQAERLILRLCKHWGHKFPVEHNAQRGEIELPMGSCRMISDSGLKVELEAPAQQMERFREVVVEHLQRMAAKEELAIQWQ